MDQSKILEIRQAVDNGGWSKSRRKDRIFYISR